MLHLIFQSPLEHAVLARIAAGDDVVFLENAVLALLKNGQWASRLTVLAEHSPLFVLQEAIIVRGLGEDALATGLVVLDYAGLVALTVKHTAIQSWF